MKKIKAPNWKFLRLLLAASVALAASAQAQTTYDAFAANNDACSPTPANPAHAVLFAQLDPSVATPDSNYRFVFAPTPGSFVENADGSARLSGTLSAIYAANRGFNLDVTFAGPFTNPAIPINATFEELGQNCYVAPYGFGGTVDPRTFKYYTSYAGGIGVLTGTGAYAGAIIHITPKSTGGFIAQVGNGANGKNVTFGLSGWFNWQVIQQPTSGIVLRDSDFIGTTGGSMRVGMPLYGDFNINIRGGACTRTPGYWKNHPNAWPIQNVVAGGVTYTQKQAIAQLQEPKATGDATKILIFHLIAAKLNVAAGTTSGTIAQTISAADAFLVANKLNSNPTGAKRALAISLAATLDQYNNGLLGPQHCD
jgi:hypothetical protein